MQSFCNSAKRLFDSAMGCCYSLCKEDTNPQEGCINERTHLLVEPVREDVPPLRATQASSLPPRKADEQSALSRILQETATNVIDVGALGPHPLEAHEYNERVRLYQQRLNVVSANVVTTGSQATHHHVINITPPPQPRLLRDISQAEKIVALSQEPITQQERDLMSDAVKRASSAMFEVKVEHREDFVVPFRIP